MRIAQIDAGIAIDPERPFQSRLIKRKQLKAETVYLFITTEREPNFEAPGRWLRKDRRGAHGTIRNARKGGKAICIGAGMQNAEGSYFLRLSQVELPNSRRDLRGGR